MKSEDIKIAIKTLFEKELAETKQTDEDVLKFDFENRMNEFSNQAKSLQLGTHISKGINPLSKGNTILFKRGLVNTPATLAGSHNIPNPDIDITGGNTYYIADASIYSLLNLILPDGSRFVDLLIAQDDRLKKALSDDEDKSQEIYEKLIKTICNPITESEADAFNKQLYFPLNADKEPLSRLDEFKYINIIPLYPSSLNKEVTLRLRTLREKKREAWEASKKGEITEGFSTISNMALIGLGGTRPANTSKLAQKSAGSNYLLRNLPPKMTKTSSFYLPKNANSIFRTKALTAHTKPSVKNLMLSLTGYDTKTNTKNNVQASLTQAISAILDLAFALRGNEKGWLSDHKLNMNEKFWLDPNRGDIKGQHVYKAKRESMDWKPHIVAEITKFLITQVEMLAKYKNKKLNVELDSYLFEDWRVVTQKTVEKYNRHKNEVL